MRVIISAGGTGGHIYPALAIINKIKEEEPDSEFLYIGTTDRMEKDLIPSMGYRYEGLEVTGLKRKLSLDNIKTITNFLGAIKKAKVIIKDFNPDIVIGCGGYVTAPVIYAAKKLGKRTFIHEQNSVVGLANKFLSKYTDKVGVSFESTINDFPKGKAVLTGNPCSEKALSIKKTTKKELEIDEDKKLVLIVMGSLGSRSVNDKIFSFIDNFRNKNYSVIIVTGNSYYEKVKDKRVPKNVKVLPFIYEMPKVMKITDLMVTRAGASTMSEITALGVPAIFVPSPYVANNHQYKNAMDLVEHNAGIMLEEKDLDGKVLIELIDKTLNDKDKIIIYEELNSIIPGGNIIFTNKKDNNDNIIVCYVSKTMLPLEKTYEYINNYILVQRPLNCYMIGNILNSYFNTLLENSNTITYVDLNSVHESIKDKLDNVYDKTTCILDILKNNLIIKNNTIVFDCKDFLNSNNKVFIYAIALNNLKKLLNKNKFYIYDSSLTMISDNDKSYLYNVLYHAIYSENFNIEEAVTKSIDTNKVLENQTFVNSIVNKNNNSL